MNKKPPGRALVVLAVILCIAASVLFMTLPTLSVEPDVIYQNF